MEYTIAVDCGGTFTDCIILDSQGEWTTGKVASTPPNYTEGIFAAITEAAAARSLSCEEVLAQAVVFGHGTTVGTNTLLTRTGTVTGLLTTRGFEDTIIIGRTVQKVAGLTDTELGNFATFNKAEPIVPRTRIRGVSERIDWQGKIVTPLSLTELAEAVEDLVSQGVKTISICFLWSFLNPSHEHEARTFIQKQYPELFVTISSSLCPVLGEYERTATVAINAYISEKVSFYLMDLEKRLEGAQFHHKAFVMQSSGGVTSLQQARQQPVSLLASGPVGGILAAAKVSKQLGYTHVVTSDVGGTSFDVGLLVDGTYELADAPVLSKYHLALPMVDITSIGAGGGSIAWLEAGTGVFKVGPRSAGALPGPVCYGQGGTEPTVTDANLVLGRLDSEYFLGGRRRLDVTAARSAIAERIAKPLGWSTEQAAMGIIDIVDAHMADLLRKTILDRSYDPRDFVLFAFGGAGPLHISGYARHLGVKMAVLPALSAEFSAYGIAAADVLVVREHSEPMAEPFDLARLTAIFQRLEQEARQQLASAGIGESQIVVSPHLLLRYRGQVHEIRTPVPKLSVGQDSLSMLINTFEQRYERKYGPGTAYRSAGIEITTFQLHAYGQTNSPARLLAPPVPFQLAADAHRPVFFTETAGWCQTPVYRIKRLGPGHALTGPAIIEAPDTTLVVHPGESMKVDLCGNFLLTLGA